MKREIIKTETSTADFAYGEDERVYIFCLVEIYKENSPEGPGAAEETEGSVAGGTADVSVWQRAFEGVRTLPVESPFARGQDETGAQWRRLSQTDSLWEETQGLCPFSKEQIWGYGHILLGEMPGEGFLTEERETRYYVGIPGRFTTDEQPFAEAESGAGQNAFTLWQPMAGAEKLYERIEDAGEEELAYIYGYWIAQVNPESGGFGEA